MDCAIVAFDRGVTFVFVKIDDVQDVVLATVFVNHEHRSDLRFSAHLLLHRSPALNPDVGFNIALLQFEDDRVDLFEC